MTRAPARHRSRTCATGYADADEFIADLALIGASLRANRGEHAGWFAVRRVLRRARTFGFHLATLDVRQDSRAHDVALAALLGDDDWATRSVPERAGAAAAVLSPAHAAPRARRRAAAASTLAVFRTLAEPAPRYGDAARSAPTSSA